MMSFNNIQPRTREQRAALKNKEKIEDQFIKERTGDYNHQDHNAKVFTTDSKSTHFITGHCLPRNRQIRQGFLSRTEKG
jgi:hypothetical protein